MSLAVSRTDRLLSARDAEKLLGIPASTVRTWHQRKDRTHLYPADFDRTGKPRFREADLIRLRDGKRQIRGPLGSPAYGELGRYLSAKDAQNLLGIPASTVTTWHQRKLETGLWSVGVDHRDHPFFYEVDLLVLRRGWTIKNSEGERIHTMRDLA